MITIIAAVSENGVIGNGGVIPWRLSSDLRRFKQTTLDSTVVMGRKTWESLPTKPLPLRQNIVVTSAHKVRGAQTATSIEEAILMAKHEQLFIIGGARMYEEGLIWSKRMIITKVLSEIQGDTFFPEFDQDEWEVSNLGPVTQESGDDFPYQICTYLRK